MATKFDSRLDYKDYLVKITGQFVDDTLCDIEGLYNGTEFSYSTSPNLGNSGFMNQASSAIGGWISQRGALGKFIESNVNSVWSTFQKYEGASPNSFSIPIHIFNSNTPYSTVLPQLLKLVQPKIDFSFMTSYLYSVTDSVDVFRPEAWSSDTIVDPYRGKLLTVQIGEWFMATELLCNSLDLSWSTYVDTSGVPIYLSCNFGFTTHRTMTVDEIAGYFRV